MSSLATSKPAATLPPTGQLLTMGGDGRIVCDPETGTNKYNCRPMPEPLLAYGSATASTISAHAFAAAEHLREQLEDKVRLQLPWVTYALELQRIRTELRQLLKLNDTEILFASSGTDIHLIAAQLANPNASPLILMMEAAETGSGVPKALAGQHFSDTTVSGDEVMAGTPIEGATAPDVVMIASRKDDGSARPMTEVDAEFETHVVKAASAGRAVLLILTDVSKTGLIAPSITCVQTLHKRFPEQIEVLVDGCQFRLSASTLQAYLEQGYMVAVTGSKFMSGPAFSGALLVPKTVATRLQSRLISKAFAQYSVQADWPNGWAAQNLFPDIANFGLLLRWQAALAEMQRFYALSETAITAFAERFATAVQERIASNPSLEALPISAYERVSKNWDSIPTIFPFLLREANGAWLVRNDTDLVYRRLRKENNMEVGQPVPCGTRDKTPVSALRLCLSARLIADALTPGGRGSDAVINDALAVLDKAATLTIF